MKRYFTLARLRNGLALLILLLLIAVLAAKATRQAIYKRSKGYKLTYIESSALYLANHIPLNPLRVFDKVLEAGNVDGIVRSNLPKDDFVYLDDNKAKIPVKLLYHYYDKERSIVIVRLRNLNTNTTEHEVSIPLQTIKQSYSDFQVYYRENYEVEFNTKFGDKITDPVSDVEAAYFLHPYLFEDGSVLIRATEYGPALKFDKQGKLQWQLNRICHHSVEVDADNHIWTCSYSPTSKEERPLYYQDDIIQVDSKTGEILWQKRIEDIYQSTPRYDLSRSSSLNPDRYHINDVQPVLQDARYWNKGDLFISVREDNAVLLYRPSTDQILWLNNTYWSSQHDVNVLSDSTISIFNNCSINTYEGRKPVCADTLSRFMIYNFDKDSAYVRFIDVFERFKIYTEVEGRAKWQVQDSVLFVENSLSDQIIFHNLKNGNSHRLVIKHPTPGKVRFVTWARTYPLSFQVQK